MRCSAWLMTRRELITRRPERCDKLRKRWQAPSRKRTSPRSVRQFGPRSPSRQAAVSPVSISRWPPVRQSGLVSSIRRHGG